MVLQELRDLRDVLAHTLKQESSVVMVRMDPDGAAWLLLGPETTGSFAAEMTNPSACAQPQPQVCVARDV